MSDFKNFGMMIPKTTYTHIGNGSYIWIEIENQDQASDFKKWLIEQNVVQLKLENEYIDLWQMRNDMVLSDGHALQYWFDVFKNPPSTGYSFSSYTIPKK